MSQTILVTGAGSGFGALTARALAKHGHTVFAGLFALSQDNMKQRQDAVVEYARENKVDLRSVALNLVDETSVKAAVKEIIEQVGHLDVIIHNAGHMNYGPAESFTAEQCLQLYDVNVVGAQRLNQAILPYMRQRRSGHLIWIGSSSVYGAKSPMLGAYFAAKAAMDSLATAYQGELSAWGIESTIVSPGVFTKGTDHFTTAMLPGLPDVAAEYEADGAPTKGIGERTMAGTGSVVPDWAEPSLVADALVELTAMPRGKKPFRMTVDPAQDGGEEAAAVVDRNKINIYRRFGILDLLTVKV